MKYRYEVYIDGRLIRPEYYDSDEDYQVGDTLKPSTLSTQERPIIVVTRTEIKRENDSVEPKPVKLECKYK